MATTVYIDSNPDTLGTNATQEDLERYAANLERLLSTEFNREVEVELVLGGGLRHCPEDEAIDQYVLDLESGDGWTVLMGQSEEKSLSSSAARSYSSLSFHVPPRNQGQIIEVAYAVDAEREEIVSRSRDASDGSEAYAVTPLDNLVGEFEPWNREPGFLDDGLWEPVS